MKMKSETSNKFSILFQLSLWLLHGMLVKLNSHLGPVHMGTQSFRSISFRSKKWNAQGLRSHGNA